MQQKADRVLEMQVFFHLASEEARTRCQMGFPIAAGKAVLSANLTERG
jgi:hypothetical protein